MARAEEEEPACSRADVCAQAAAATAAAANTAVGTTVLVFEREGGAIMSCRAAEEDFCSGGDDHKTREQMNMIITFREILLKIRPGVPAALASATKAAAAAAGQAFTNFTEYSKVCW